MEEVRVGKAERNVDTQKYLILADLTPYSSSKQCKNWYMILHN